MEVVRNRDDFYSTLRELVGDNYSLGIHGIEGDVWIRNGDTYVLDKEKVVGLKKSILEKGLVIVVNRKIASTVMFDDFDSYMCDGNYEAGGVIVAICDSLTTNQGESIPIGTITDLYDDRNYDVSSIAELVVPYYGENSGILDPMFILGTYDKMEDDKVKITINEKHIHFNCDCVPQEYFDLKKKQIEYLRRTGVINESGLIRR